mgnify:CR=1 FL=1
MNKAVILAGGQGKRMKAEMPKPLFKVLGEPMLRWVISACEAADLTDICVVKGFKGEMIDEYLGGQYKTVLQAERLGTGHAVKQAVPFLEEDTDGNTLVLCGDGRRLHQLVGNGLGPLGTVCRQYRDAEGHTEQPRDDKLQHSHPCRPPRS